MKIIKDHKLNLGYHRVQKIKWGVSGCGNYLESVFLPVFETLKRSSLVSVYSSSISRAKTVCEKFGASSAFDNFDEFIKTDFDILYIAGSNHTHYEQVIKAAKAGKNILCEKPLALSYQQAKEMYEVCVANEVFLSVNYKFRYHPLIRKTKELLEKGILGKIVSINAAFNIDFSPQGNFRFNPEQSGGGVLRDLGTHLIDLFRYFNGEILSAEGILDNVVYKSEVEDFASAVLKFKNDSYGLFNVSYCSMKASNRIEITGHKGCITIEDLFGKRQGLAKMSIDLAGESKKAFRKRANDQALLLKDLQRCYLQSEKPLIDGYDGSENMRIIELIEKKRNSFE